MVAYNVSGNPYKRADNANTVNGHHYKMSNNVIYHHYINANNSNGNQYRHVKNVT